MAAMSYIAALAFLAILACLGSAGFFLLRKGAGQTDGRRSRAMSKALAWRVGLSIALFVCLLLSWKLGWIQPTGLPLRG